MCNNWPDKLHSGTKGNWKIIWSDILTVFITYDEAYIFQWDLKMKRQSKHWKSLTSQKIKNANEKINGNFVCFLWYEGYFYDWLVNWGSDILSKILQKYLHQTEGKSYKNQIYEITTHLFFTMTTSRYEMSCLSSNFWAKKRLCPSILRIRQILLRASSIYCEMCIDRNAFLLCEKGKWHNGKVEQ